MKLIITSFYLFISVITFAQTIDLTTLPTYDCSLKKIMAIIGKKTIIVSPEDNKSLEKILADYCSTLGNNCVLKKESELINSDLSENLFVIGVLTDFKKWKGFSLPVTRTQTGFLLNKIKFEDKADGFVFIDTNRIIISGNTLQAVKDAQLALTGGHDILITQKGKITYFGNKKGQLFNWFNLQKLTAANYKKTSSDLFSAIYISNTFKDTLNYQNLNKELKLYVQQFLSIYKLNIPEKKVSWFLHSNMQEYGTMSGMFGLTCPGNASAGFSIRNEIHTNGFNNGLVKHEYSHFLFDNAIPQEHNPAFFVEGCVEYVTNLNDSSLYKQRIETARKYKDTLNYSDLIVSNKDFYGSYSEANYAVCGVFVKYLIDRFGVDNFKKYCLANDKSIAAQSVFKKDFNELIKDYKQWLNRQ